MAITQQALGFAAGSNLFRDTSAANAAQTVKSSAGTIFGLVIDNTLNGAASYVKLYFTNAVVTIGTTVPDMVLFAPASQKVTYWFSSGLAFTLGLQEGAVTAGGTGGTTSPTSAVDLQVVYS